MATIKTTKKSRLYDFQSGSPARSAEVDAEFNQIISELSNIVDDLTALNTSGTTHEESTTAHVASKLVNDSTTTGTTIADALTNIATKIAAHTDTYAADKHESTEISLSDAVTFRDEGLQTEITNVTEALNRLKGAIDLHQQTTSAHVASKIANDSTVEVATVGLALSSLHYVDGIMNETISGHITKTGTARHDSDEITNNAALANGETVSEALDLVYREYASLRNILVAHTDGSDMADVTQAILLPNVNMKLQNGSNIKITGLGDSIMQGLYNSGWITESKRWMNVLKATLEEKYDCTVTISNRGIGGYSITDCIVKGGLASAISDNADLYIIMFGMNDHKYENAKAPHGCSLSDYTKILERIVLKIKADVPNADILLLGTSPATYADTTGNAIIKTYVQAVKQIASYYGLAFVNMFDEFSKRGDWTYLQKSAYDVHPNDEGHALYANTIYGECFNANVRTIKPSILPAKSYTDQTCFKDTDYKTLSFQGTVNYSSKTYLFGGDWNNGSGTWTATAVDSTAYINACCSEIIIEANVTGLVKCKFIVDGKLKHNNVTLDIGDIRLTFPFSTPGVHSVKIVVISGTTGTLKLPATYSYEAPRNFYSHSNSMVTLSVPSNWGSSTNISGSYSGSYRSNATTGETVSFTFVGTGVALQSKPSTGFNTVIGVTIDNGTEVPITLISDELANVSTVLSSSLPYGRHTVVIRIADTYDPFMFEGFYVLDSTLRETPSIQRGIANVSDVITFPTAFSSPPFLKITNGGYTGLTKTGFAVSGTAGQEVTWEAIGNRVAY